MLFKWCTQYASKFGKLNHGCKTGKGQFSFQSWRKDMAKNTQTTAQLHWYHMPARKCSKFFHLAFNSTWTENFQMYKLDLEKAEKPEIRLPTPTGTQKKQGNYRKISISASLTMLQPLTVWIATICGKFFFKRWEYQITLPASKKTCMQGKKQ